MASDHTCASPKPGRTMNNQSQSHNSKALNVSNELITRLAYDSVTSLCLEIVQFDETVVIKMMPVAKNIRWQTTLHNPRQSTLMFPRWLIRIVRLGRFLQYVMALSLP